MRVARLVAELIVRVDMPPVLARNGQGGRDEAYYSESGNNNGREWLHVERSVIS